MHNVIPKQAIPYLFNTLRPFGFTPTYYILAMFFPAARQAVASRNNTEDCCMSTSRSWWNTYDFDRDNMLFVALVNFVSDWKGNIFPNPLWISFLCDVYMYWCDRHVICVHDDIDIAKWDVTKELRKKKTTCTGPLVVFLVCQIICLSEAARNREWQSVIARILLLENSLLIAKLGIRPQILIQPCLLRAETPWSELVSEATCRY